MKTKLTILGSLAAIGAASSLNAQAVTAAVGYHTEELAGNAFNVLGVNVGFPVSAAGVLEGAGNDVDVDFTTLLTAGTPYTIQNKTTGESAELTGWTANDVMPAIGSANDTYEIRQAQTINDIFGAANEAGLLEGDRPDADVIWVPDGTGGFTRFYRNNVTDSTNFLDIKSPGWREISDGNTDVGDTVIPFHFGIFLQTRSATPDPLVFVGHVRGEDDIDDGHGSQTTALTLAGDNSFNIVNRVVPVGITLAEIGATDLLTAGDRDDADVLWNPDGTGNYVRYYNNNVNDSTNFLDIKTPGLREISDGQTDQSGAVVASGFLVQRRAAPGSVSVLIPARLDL